MTVPVPPERFDAVGFAREAQRRGFTTDEIASVLEQRGAAQYAKEFRRAAEPSATNFGQQVGEGILSGIGRPLVAAAGTAVQKLTGDDRPIGEIYGQLKGDVDARDHAYRAANPGKAFAANVAGGVVAGRANPMMVLGEGTPVIGRALPGVGTRAGRAVNAAANAGAFGTAGGFLNSDAETLAGRAKDGAVMGGVSALAGGVLSPVVEAGAATARALTPKTMREFLENVSRPRLGGGEAPPALPASTDGGSNLPVPRPTPMLDRVRAAQRPATTAPRPTSRELQGAEMLFSRLQKQGMGLPTLRARSSAADDPDMIAEVIGDKATRDLGQAYILGNRTDDIVETIKTRAAGENARVADRILNRTGAGQLDARTINDTYTATRGPLVGKLNAETAALPARPEMVRGIAETVADLGDRGVNVWGKAVSMSKDFPRSPFADPETGTPIENMTLGQLRTLRKTLDGLINYGANPLNTNSAEAMASGQLRDVRRMVNAAIKDAGGDAAAAQKAGIADEMIADAKRGVSAFQKGEDLNADTPAELLRIMGEDGKPNMARLGRASGLAKTIAGKRDGTTGGTVQNPVDVLVGSPKARMNARAAFDTDADFEATLQDAQNVNRRLATGQKVLGGSPTAQRLGDMAEQVGGPVNPMDVLNAVANPQQAVAGGLSRLWNPVQRRFLGDQMDAYAPFLMAGGPNQMSREDAVALAERLFPVLQAQWAQQVMTRGRVGAEAGRRLR